MKPHLWLAVVLTASLFFAACSNRNEIRVVNKNFDDQIAEQQNLEFSFNKDIYPDSLLQQWDTTQYIEFHPAVRGSFRWTSSSELQFSPSEGFAPGTDYKATLTSQLLKRTDKKYHVQHRQITFHTAPLQITGADLSYARGKNEANVMAQLTLNFNYNVNVGQAATKIKLSNNGNAITPNVVNGGKDKTVVFQFTPLETRDGKDAVLKVEIGKGIAMANGNYKTDQDSVFKMKVPSRSVLSVADIKSEHNGTEATITLTTSQPIIADGIQQMVTIEPNVAFSVQASDDGITVTSAEMKPDQTYQLTLSKSLQGQFGGAMKDDYSEQITFGALEPTIKFANTKGMYLSSRGYKNIALQIVNVPKVEVTVIKVYENNLEGFFRKGTSYGYDYSDEEGDNESGSYDYYDTENIGDTVDHQLIETSKLPSLNAARILHLDFQDKIKGYNGIYVIKVSSTDKRWVQSSKILCLSDIGLILKEDDQNIYVFANSIRDARAMSGVNVSFISSTNQRLYQSTTDGDGMCVFANVKQQAPGFRTSLVTARKGDEFSFLLMDQSSVETSRFDVGGRTPNTTGLNAMIYAERNLYRPGEVAHVSAIVRDENWNPAANVPVKLKLTMPNGKEFATMRKILNDEGSCETIFPIPYTAMTGTYTLEVFSGNDVLLNSYDISVEDFMPDRLKATIKVDKENYAPGDSISETIQADNLFGTPAMNRSYESELNIVKASFESKEYDDYNFSINKDFDHDPDFRGGLTDERGAAHETFGLSTDLNNTGLLRGNLVTTVFDETGRPVHRYAHFNIYTQQTFIGIKGGSDYVSTRETVHIPLVALGTDGKLQRGAQATVEVIKKEWHTVIEQTGDHYRYVSKEETKTILTNDIVINGTSTSFSFIPSLSGDYEVRVSLKGSDAYVSKYLYAWGYGDSEYTSFEVNNEGNVEIKPDKDKYNQGDKIKLLFTTPFEGRMLVTVERNHLMEHYYLNTNNKSCSLTMNAADWAVPNVYVSATLFRPMDGTDMPLTVAHGYRNVPVENLHNHLPVQVTMAQKTRSKTKQQITVKTVPHAYVTIAAVDEGILQIKNYETPDPYIYFYQKVALAVSSYDIYPLLLPEINSTLSSTGGDGGSGDNENRVNPLFVNRVKNVSFWSGIVQADGSGTVRWNIDVPQFSGDIRVMAVAYKGKGFGGADQHMKVADPVVISAGLPRVLSPRDVVTMPVTLSNTTAKDMTADVAVVCTGTLNISGTAAQRVTIPANREARVVFIVAAMNSIGAGKVNVVVKAAGETFTNETELAVRPPASLQKVTGSGVVNAGSSLNINTAMNFIPASAKGSLIIGKSPLVQFSKNLDYLVHYPYGCVEQTVSTAFPQLYYADLVKSITGQNTTDPNPGYNVQQAIAKLQSMQLSNGALSYWPDAGMGTESWWGSIYAANFLLEAKKAGYEVNAHTLDHLIQYMKFKLQKRSTEILYYNRTLSREIAAKEVPYSLYVLALAGQPQVATMNYYKGNLSMLSIDGKYMLAAAYALSGMPQQAKQVLPSNFAGEESNTAFGGSFYSYTRDMGVSLSAMLDMNPSDPQVPVLVQMLSQRLKTQPYLNTQENVWGILALGKMARISNKTNATATVTAGGKQIAMSTGDAVSMDIRSYLNRSVSMSVKGTGSFYYFWEASGITADGSYKQEDSYLKVRRTYFDRNGKIITGNQFRQNQLIVVKLSLQSSWQTEVENVVVTDMLPAGFEIENTRLNDLPGMSWIKNESTPDYLDYRDDRLNLFTSASGTQRDFYYMVRAVSPGTFQLGPVQADAMYNGFFHSYNGAGTVTVVE